MANDKQQLVSRILSHADEAESPVAIEQGDRTVTYAELRAMVEERTAALLGRGAAGCFVAIERAKSPEFIVDFLSVLAAGGAVVPLDPDTPAERRATFLDLVRPELLLRDTGLAQLSGERARLVNHDGGFVFFTSGSTGIPKPVLGSVAALRGFVDWFCPEFGVTQTDRFCFLAGVSFEASLRDIFPPLASGSTLVLPEDDDLRSPEATVGWLARKGVTVVTVVPSVARSWLRHGVTACDRVRAAFFLGEPLPADLVAAWQSRFPGTTERVNSYGSTESGQATIYKRVARGEELSDRVPAGQAVPGTRYCLIPPEAGLDAALVRERLDRPAVSGEIVLVSRACSHGYLGMPEQNAARFVDLGEGVTAYRTGDLGRVADDGDLVVIGRVDDEVKINGVRVHPAEVTRAVRAYPAVRDAFVVATPADAAAEARLTAYLEPADNSPLSVPDLRRHLVERLPLAMIPPRFVQLAELPRTRTGKIDRAALVAAGAAEGAAEDFVPPSGEVECWLADQFTELLSPDRASATDDLFALGCDSITATMLASRIWDEFGVQLSLRDLFAAATVRDIAAGIVEQDLLSADPAELRALLDAMEGRTLVPPSGETA